MNFAIKSTQKAGIGIAAKGNDDGNQKGGDSYISFEVTFLFEMSSKTSSLHIWNRGDWN